MRDHSNSKLSSDLETHQKKMPYHVINLVYNQGARKLTQISK
jgi:hypothetical protein